MSLNALLTEIASGATPWKNAVRVAATSNVTLSGLQTIDGVSLAAGDRVLLTAQTLPVENFIWVVAATGWTRAVDAKSASYIKLGSTVRVMEGTNAGVWVLTSPTSGEIRVDSTELTFAVAPGAALSDDPPLDVTEGAADAGVSTEASRSDHHHKHDTAVVGGHTNANGGQAGFMSATQYTALETRTAAATNSAMVVRGASAEAAFGAVTSTALTVTNLLKVDSEGLTIGNGTSEADQDGAIDILEIEAPSGNPAAGRIRIWLDDDDDILMSRNSSGEDYPLDQSSLIEIVSSAGTTLSRTGGTHKVFESSGTTATLPAGRKGETWVLKALVGCTITRGGSDVFKTSSAATSNTLVLADGDSRTIVYDAANTRWIVH